MMGHGTIASVFVGSRLSALVACFFASVVVCSHACLVFCVETPLSGDSLHDCVSSSRSSAPVLPNYGTLVGSSASLSPSKPCGAGAAADHARRLVRAAKGRTGPQAATRRAVGAGTTVRSGSSCTRASCCKYYSSSLGRFGDISPISSLGGPRLAHRMSHPCTTRRRNDGRNRPHRVSSWLIVSPSPSTVVGKKYLCDDGGGWPPDERAPPAPFTVLAWAWDVGKRGGGAGLGWGALGCAWLCCNGLPLALRRGLAFPAPFAGGPCAPPPPRPLGARPVRQHVLFDSCRPSPLAAEENAGGRWPAPPPTLSPFVVSTVAQPHILA